MENTKIDYAKYGLKPGIVHCGGKEFDLRTMGVAAVSKAINEMIRQAEVNHGKH